MKSSVIKAAQDRKLRELLAKLHSCSGNLYAGGDELQCGA